jgi:hypothetical protein
VILKSQNIANISKYSSLLLFKRSKHWHTVHISMMLSLKRARHVFLITFKHMSCSSKRRQVHLMPLLSSYIYDSGLTKRMNYITSLKDKKLYLTSRSGLKAYNKLCLCVLKVLHVSLKNDYWVTTLWYFCETVVFVSSWIKTNMISVSSKIHHGADTIFVFLCVWARARSQCIHSFIFD